MQSTKENPLAFFSVYFESGIANAVIKHQAENDQIENFVNTFSSQHIPDEIRTLPFKKEDHINFEEYVLNNTKPEIKISKEFIEQGHFIKNLKDLLIIILKN